MELIHLDKVLDVNKEIELTLYEGFGFKVEIEYTEESWYEIKKETICNCTEVHHLWSLDYMGGPSIAFESDTHSTGFTRRTDTIKSVSISLCDKLYNKYVN